MDFLLRPDGEKEKASEQLLASSSMPFLNLSLHVLCSEIFSGL